jgi:hypothetical protein
MTDADPTNADQLDIYLAIAINHLSAVVAELTTARDALQRIYKRGADDPARLRNWQQTLDALHLPLYSGVSSLHTVLELLAARTGRQVPEDPLDWLAPRWPRPERPEQAQAQALADWLMPQVEQTPPPRVRTMLDRDLQSIIAGRGGTLAGLDNAAFLAELGKPDGGKVGLVAGIGPAGVAVLREVLRVDIS